MAFHSRNIGLIADYAREVVREYLHIRSEEQPPADDDAERMFQGFRVSGKEVAKQFRDTNPELFADDIASARQRRSDVLERWMSNPPRALEPLAEMAVLFGLTHDDVELFIMAAAPAIDPEVDELYAYVRNNVHKRNADIGFICQILSLRDAEAFESLLLRCAFDAPLRKHRLLLVEGRASAEDDLDLNLVSRRVRAADRVLDFLRHHRDAGIPTIDEALSTVCARLWEPLSIDDLGLPEHASQSLLQLARTRTLPVAFLGPEGAGKQRAAQALAGPLKSGVLSADLSALLNEDHRVLETRLAELFREARLGGDLVYLYGHNMPQEITGPVELVLQRFLAKEQLVLGVDRLPVWASQMTTGWPVVTIPLPSEEARVTMWKECFATDRTPPSEAALVQVARRYQLSHAQIQQAATEARRIVQVNRRKRMGLSDLDRACRIHFAHQLSELADLVPPSTFSIDDLILPNEEKDKFSEMLFYAAERETIFSEWGFGEKFPYGQGLSMLFYGPPGTGKSLSSMIISSQLGVDLFRVDLSRILSRYVGETEKNLAKIFDEAERGRVMLLFDEADSLFTKRTDVQTSVDRYANLEVAYLLQRMENFEGITVLTTNVEHMLDDAFKRRIRYRIYFPMPDASLRAELWEKLLPKSAPKRDDIDFEVLGDSYELAGGYIKQAVIRAAVYARRDDRPIALRHLHEAAHTECKELGMLMSSKLPEGLSKALAREDELVAAEAAPKKKKKAKKDEPPVEKSA